MTETSEPVRQDWMDMPLMVDHQEGVEVVEPETFQMQVEQLDGSWMPLGSPRSDRDEVTRIQAYYLNHEKDGESDGRVRVLRRIVTWTVDEVPGDGTGQTPASEILARNERLRTRLLTQGTEHQPAE